MRLTKKMTVPLALTRIQILSQSKKECPIIFFLKYNLRIIKTERENAQLLQV